MITFNDAYSLHGPDVEAIAKDMGITQPYADILINAHMEQKYRSLFDINPTARQEYMLRRRDESRAIRQQNRVA